MTFRPLDIGIIDFFESDAILGIKTLSATQKVILKVINGEHLDTKKPIPKEHEYQERAFENEVDLFLYLTGKDEYIPGHRYSDMSLDAGRRGGKSNVIGAGLACYYATQKSYAPYLGTSPSATLPIISPTKEQAGEVFAAIKSFFLRSPYLFNAFLDGNINGFEAEYDEKDTDKKVFIGGQIRLNNKVVIKTLAADVSKIRGFAVFLYILDECAWFGTDNNSDLKSSDKGIFEAIQPATAQFGDLAFGIKISSPNGEAGLMYDDYLNRKEEDVLHFKAPTWYMNPSISVKYLEKQRKKGDHYFNREYGAEYTSSENSYLDPKLVEACQILGMERLPYEPGNRYVAALDYATKGDFWTFAIGHKQYAVRDVLDNGKTVKEKYHHIIVDLLMHWKGSQGAELDPKEVVAEISEQLKEYRVGYALSDQYAFAALRNLFEQHGQLIKEFKTSMQSKKKYMYSLQVAVNSSTLRYVSNKIATKHLKDLREKRSSNGQIRIEAVANSHDDYASAIGLVIYQFDKSSPVYIGQTRDDEEVQVPETKDSNGLLIANPTAADVAEHAGNTTFYDNTQEYLEQQRKESQPQDPESESGFWFAF